MKRVLSLVLVLMLVLTTIVPAFAEETVSQDTTDLQTYGVITDAEEATPIIRAEMAVLYARLQGKGDVAEAYDMPHTYTDLPEGKWYTPWASYAAAQEWMVGFGTEWNPEANITAKEANVLLLKALGYTVEWATVNEDAAAAGIEFTTADATLPLRGEIFSAVRAILDMTPVDGTDTLGATLALEGYVAPVVEPTTLEVATFEMTNYKEAVLTFNTELDADTVVLANFVSSDEDHDIAAVTLLEDKMTVELTLVDTEEVAQYGALEVVINDVKSAAGAEIAEDTTVKVEFVVDVTVPTVVSVEAVGNSGATVTFSEPVNHTASITNYFLNGKLFAGSETVSGKASTLSFAKRLDAGVYELTIRASKVTDYAGLIVKEVVVEFVVEEDAIAPTADVLSASQTEVVVAFTEAVDSVTVATAVGTITDQKWNTAKTELTLTYDTADAVPVNGTTITLTAITDAFGNVTDTLELSTGYPTIDLTRPEVKEVTVSKQAYILVSFTEKVTEAGVFKLKDADGVVVETLTDAFYVDADAVTHYDTLKLTGTLAAGTYTLDITGVVDASPLANGLVPVVPTVVVPDATAVTIVSILEDAANNAIFVEFSEKVDAATAIDKANYSYTDTLISTPFGANETFALLEDGKTVKITFSTEADTQNTSDVDVLQIKSVQDLAGNTITTYAASLGTFAGVAPKVTLAKVTAVNTVVLTLDADIILETLAPTDFAIVASGTTISVIDATYNGTTKDTITLTVNADLDALGQYAGDDLDISMAATVQAANVYGQKLVVNTGVVTTTEGILPTVVLEDVVAGTTATLTFSENMAIDGTALASGSAINAFVFVNDALVSATVEGATIKTATITFATAVVADDVVKVVYYVSPTAANNLEDTIGNDLESFELTKTTK